MPRSGRTRRILCNDDGWIMNTPHPLTPEYMWDNMVGTYVGTPIDGFLWSVGGHDTYSYETDIGERFGDGYDNLDETQQASVDNLRYLMENHGGPMEVIAGLCKRAGVEFFPSVRMNEHYDMPESAPQYSRFRRDNPEYLIGKGEDIPAPTLEWGIRTGLDYAVPEVQELHGEYPGRAGLAMGRGRHRVGLHAPPCVLPHRGGVPQPVPDDGLHLVYPSADGRDR